MRQITKPLNPFLRRWGYGYLFESKEPIPVEGEKETGGPQEMKVHPDIFLITKAGKSDSLPYPEMYMKTIGLIAREHRLPDMCM